MNFGEDPKLMGRKEKRGKRKRGKKESYVSYDEPQLNWYKIQAFVVTATVVFIALAMIFFFFFLYSDSPTIVEIKGYAGEMARTTRTINNFTRAVERSMPEVDMNDVFNRTFPKSNEEMANITQRAVRAGSDILALISDMKESQVIKVVSSLGDSIYKILSRPNFNQFLDTIESGLPFVFDALKSDEVKSLIKAFEKMTNKFEKLLTEDRVDKVIDALDNADVKNLLSHSSEFIKEATKTVKSANIILDKVAYVVEHDSQFITPVVHTVSDVTEFIKERVKEEDLDHAIHFIKNIKWHDILKEVKSYYVILERIRDSQGTSNVSIVDIGKNLTQELSSLAKHLDNSGIFGELSESLKKVNGAIDKEELHDGYVEIMKSLKQVNEIVEEAGETHLIGDFVSLVERFERMERIIETVFTPLERGMDLYNEEQQREREEDKRVERKDIHEKSKSQTSTTRRNPSSTTFRSQSYNDILSSHKKN